MSDFAGAFAGVPVRGVSSRRAEAGVCVSGGGFRAMLFHVGAFRRMHEARALQHVARVSSVSGGSITAALVALRWSELVASDGDPAVFVRLVEEPLFAFAGKRLDVPRVVRGLATPRRSIAQSVASAYRDLFGDASLQDLPSHPRFVILATNLGTGSVVRFAQPYTADARVGRRNNLALPLAVVVAASSAFPPFLSPMVINLDDTQALTETFGPTPPELARLPYTHRLELSDGGVYDNLGLQPLVQDHTILVSDAGSPFKFSERVARNWLMHVMRAWAVTDNQVRSLRKSNLIDEFAGAERNGTYWGIKTDITQYPSPTRFTVDPKVTYALSAIHTRLWRLPKQRRRQLINWGYAVSDAALRSHLCPDLALPTQLPYPDATL